MTYKETQQTKKEDEGQRNLFKGRKDSGLGKETDNFRELLNKNGFRERDKI